jgi:NTP pyrophosphatase (non-canonical NTP hydrolase)
LRANDYQIAALRTAGAADAMTNDRVIYTALGLAGEAGEVANLTKKVIFHKHEYNREKFLDELGDVAWYLAVNSDAHGYTLEEVFEYNIKKLEERYPGGFSTDKSINRKETQ